MSFIALLEVYYGDRIRKFFTDLLFCLLYFIDYKVFHIDFLSRKCSPTERVTKVTFHNKYYCAHCGKELTVKLPLDNWLGIYKLKEDRFSPIGVYFCYGCNHNLNYNPETSSLRREQRYSKAYRILLKYFPSIKTLLVYPHPYWYM